MIDDFGTYRAKAAAAAEVLQGYYDPALGLYADGVERWWPSATALESVIDYMTLTNSAAYYDIIETTFVNAQKKAKGFINAYYDDEGWWTVAWIKAYDFTGHEKYLQMAQSIFDDLSSGWETGTCGGGLWWQKNPDYYKAAIQNELFLVVAARLHQRSGGDSRYLEWAEKEWDWFNGSGMINTSSLVNNGLNKACENDGGTTWTYNQGVILGGLVELSRITGDEALLDVAGAIADAAIATLRYPSGILQEPCEPGGSCDDDQECFKGIFVRYLAQLYAHLPADEQRRDRYRKFLTSNADSVWVNDRSAANQFDIRWVGPFEKVSVPTQMAALDAFNAAIPFDPPQ